MSDKNTKQPQARMVEDEARERQKKRDRDRGLVTIDSNDKTSKKPTATKGKDNERHGNT